MATLNTIQDSIEWAKTYNGYRPLTVGVNNEPAITAANIILQTVIGPPFSWNWNRGSVTFTTAIGIQDYPTSAPQFGFIEKGSYKIPPANITNTALVSGVATYTASNSFRVGDIVTITGLALNPAVYNAANQSITSASGTQFTVNIANPDIASASDTGVAVVGTTTEIGEIVNILGTGSELGSPVKIAPQIDDNAGNITFRLLPTPDRVYAGEVIFQKKPAALIANLTDLWAPVPDNYSYIYQWGFLALMQAYNNSMLWTQSNQKFVSNLLGAAEGLSEEQRNVFQNAWLNTITEQQARTLETNQGVERRQV